MEALLLVDSLTCYFLYTYGFDCGVRVIRFMDNIDDLGPKFEIKV